jgi:hypothetical protein
MCLKNAFYHKIESDPANILIAFAKCVNAVGLEGGNRVPQGQVGAVLAARLSAFQRN